MLRDIVAKREKELPVSTIGRLIQIAEEDKSVISLGPGEPDFAPPPNVMAAAKRAIAEGKTNYSPVSGRKELIEAIIRKVKKENGIEAKEENIIVTSGSTEGILLAMLSCIDPGEGVLYPDPGFLAYKPAIEILNGSPLHYHLDPETFEPSMEHVGDMLVREKTKIMIINTPSNPTGAVFPKKKLEEVAGFAVENDLLVVSDEAYEEYVYENARHVSIGSLNGMEDRVITLFTFSKTYGMQGFRVGYAAGREDIINAMRKLHVFTTISAPTVGQIACIEALKERSRKYIDRIIAEYNRRRVYILKRLEATGFECNSPKGAFYVFPGIRPFRRNSLAFSRLLLEKAKVAVVPGIEFGYHGEGHIRLSYATGMKKIEAGMDRIERLCRKLH